MSRNDIYINDILNVVCLICGERVPNWYQILKNSSRKPIIKASGRSTQLMMKSIIRYAKVIKISLTAMPVLYLFADAPCNINRVCNDNEQNYRAGDCAEVVEYSAFWFFR